MVIRKTESGRPARRPLRFLTLLCFPLIAATLAGAMNPATICYSVQPNPYLTDHAADIKEILDGFFFVAGSWEAVSQRFLGGATSAPAGQAWLSMARANLAALRKAGVTENFLGVSFNSDGAWPSPDTLLSESYSKRMAGEFSALGKVAKDLGFRGVSIDLEYPYPRYSLDHKIYAYSGYTAEDLIKAAYQQGYRNTAALLDAFPEAPILLLPGELRARPIAEAYMLGLMKCMADRNAPGGFHFATEYTYCIQDPVTNLATARAEDASMEVSAGADVAAYYRRTGSMAPGVWPLHMVETDGQGAKEYLYQPWKKEAAELREQMAIIRTVAKRWVWTFTGHPSWYLYTPELERKYGLTKQEFRREDVDLRDWHRILADKPVLPASSALARLVAGVRQFDRGRMTPEELCDLFGTPARWWVLGVLGNPHTRPQFTAMEALAEPINPKAIYHGRDTAVRWFQFDNFDPRGATSGRYIFGYRGYFDSSAHFVTFVQNPQTRKAVLHAGYESGIIIRLGENVILDASTYPEKGKQVLYLDKYRFEKHVPFILARGKTRLSVTCINARDRLSFTLRITDEHGIPFEDVRFRLE